MLCFVRTGHVPLGASTNVRQNVAVNNGDLENKEQLPVYDAIDGLGEAIRDFSDRFCPKFSDTHPTPSFALGKTPQVYLV